MSQKVKEAIREQFGKEPEEVVKKSEGLKHETYTAKLDGKEFIVQFSADDYEHHESLEHCLSMYELFKDSEIPVPETVTEEPATLEGEKYIIVEKLPGENMEQDISEEKVRQAARILAKIHDFRSFEHEGHIEFTEEGMKVHPFKEGNQKENHRAEREEKLDTLRENDLEELADQLDEYLSENIDDTYPKEFEAVLCHDDLSPDQTIWKEGEITGVIDFDYAFSRLPERNLVKAANAFWMHEPVADWNIRETFYQAYKEEREVTENFDEMEKYFRIETLAWLVSGLIQMGEVNDEEKEFYDQELLKELKK